MEPLQWSCCCCRYRSHNKHSDNQSPPGPRQTRHGGSVPARPPVTRQGCKPAYANSEVRQQILDAVFFAWPNVLAERLKVGRAGRHPASLIHVNPSLSCQVDKYDTNTRHHRCCTALQSGSSLSCQAVIKSHIDVIPTCCLNRIFVCLRRDLGYRIAGISLISGIFPLLFSLPALSVSPAGKRQESVYKQ